VYTRRPRPIYRQRHSQLSDIDCIALEQVLVSMATASAATSRIHIDRACIASSSSSSSLALLLPRVIRHIRYYCAFSFSERRGLGGGGGILYAPVSGKREPRSRAKAHCRNFDIFFVKIMTLLIPKMKTYILIINLNE